MIRFFVLFLFIPPMLCSQTETAILSYDVVASLNERTREISGTVHCFTTITNPSVSDFSFLIPKEWNAVSLLDVNNESIDFERTAAERPSKNRITFDRTDLETKSDTISFFITFSALFDSAATSGMFVSQKEFNLPYDHNESWLPEFASPSAEHLSLRFTAAQQFTVLSQHTADTTAFGALRTWSIDGRNIPMRTALSLCGIYGAVQQRSISPDSSCSVTFYSSPVRFNQQYAAATAEQLSNALQFFNSVTHHRFRSLAYMIVGNTAAEHSNIDTAQLVIRSNSPAFTVFDSAALTRSIYNPWITELARRFCPPTTDSTALFDDGLAAYLASRFLIGRYPMNAHRERFDAVSNALTFFPSGILAAGHSDKANTNTIISFRGRYLFFMLEYLLGRESLDAVILEITTGPSAVNLTFSRFIELCSAEYGTPLEWFFDQWLRRPSAPEYILQWKSEKTARGLSVVKAVIEQRGTLFSMPIPLTFTFGNRVITKRVRAEQQKQEFTFSFPVPPSAVELDPHLNILRWLLELRISAHAKTAQLFISVNSDIVNAEKEALYTQQLDPNNATGSAPLTLFILGNISAVNGTREKAKEYFLQSAAAASTDETEHYRQLSLIRYGNLLEVEGKRDEAVSYYQRVIAEGIKDPVINADAILQAERFLREKFQNNDNYWFVIP